jgi:predicted nucleotidyltransferase
MPALQEKANMNISELIQQKRRQVLEIAAGHGARNVRLFGSVARGETTETSDLDLLIEMEPGRSLLDIVAIKQDLEELLGCKVDVVTEAAISPYLRDKVLHEAVRL